MEETVNRIFVFGKEEKMLGNKKHSKIFFCLLPKKKNVGKGE